MSALFDLAEYTVDARRTGLDMHALGNYAFCYTATERGTCSGIRFAATVDDAQKWCSSPLSRGIGNYHTEWAYLWTRVTRFLEVFAPPLDIRGYVDDGAWDERIASTGCVKIDLRDFAAVFGPFGLAVIA